MAFTHITDEDRNGQGTVGRSDTPQLSTYERQTVLDELANLAIDGLNKHITEEAASTGAINNGATARVGCFRVRSFNWAGECFVTVNGLSLRIGIVDPVRFNRG